MQLICPPKYETAVTGFLIGCVKEIRRATWRADFYAGGVVRLSKNGEPVAGDVPAAVEAFIAKARKQFASPIEALSREG